MRLLENVKKAGNLHKKTVKGQELISCVTPGRSASLYIVTDNWDLKVPGPYFSYQISYQLSPRHREVSNHYCKIEN